MNQQAEHRGTYSALTIPAAFIFNPAALNASGKAVVTAGSVAYLATPQ